MAWARCAYLGRKVCLSHSRECIEPDGILTLKDAIGLERQVLNKIRHSADNYCRL